MTLSAPALQAGGAAARRRSWSAIAACFLAGGLGIGIWGANLPVLARRAELGDGATGVALLSFAVGALLAMTNAPRLMRRFGARDTALGAALLFGGGIAVIGQTSTLANVIPAALLTGLCFGTLDVSMNRAAAALEARWAKPVMSSLHALFSIGTLISALGYGLLLRLGWQMPLSLAATGAVIAAVAAMTALRLRGAGDAGLPAAGPRASEAAVPRARVLALGAIAFLAFLAEGAMMDWSALYLVREIGSAESTGAFGYAVFAAFLTAGRLIGDRLNARIGAARLFRLGALAVTGAVMLMLMSSSLWLVLAALGLAGFAVANIIPLIFSAAGRLSTTDGGRAMSRVLSIGYAGILLGPALMGFVAQATSLWTSFWMVAAATLVVAFSGRVLRG